MPTVRDIVAEFHKTSITCPTYGPSYSMVGQIEKFILNEDCGAERIRKGFRLAPCDPIACFVAGYLDVFEGKDDDCVRNFERALELDGALFKDVVSIYVNYLSRPQLAISTAGDDIGRLHYVASVFEDMQYYDLAEQCREKMKISLENRCKEPDAPAWVFASLANIYGKQQENKAAIECYRRALALDYAQVHWRLELAKLLARVGMIQEAIREAKICLQLRPNFEPARKLAADFSVHPAAFSEEVKSP